MVTMELVCKSGYRHVWKDGCLRCYPVKEEKEWVKKIRDFFKTVFSQPASSVKT